MTLFCRFLSTATKKNPFLPRPRCTLGVIASNCGPNAGPEDGGGENLGGSVCSSCFVDQKSWGFGGKGIFFPPTAFFCGEIEVTAVVSDVAGWQFPPFSMGCDVMGCVSHTGRWEEKARHLVKTGKATLTFPYSFFAFSPGNDHCHPPPIPRMRMRALSRESSSSPFLL